MAGTDFNYKLTNDLKFSFQNGVNLTIAMGSLFKGGFNTTDGVNFGLVSSAGSYFENAGDITPTDKLVFGFNNTNGIDNGGYNISASGAPGTAVPEPFTIIGSIIGGTSAFRMRKKLAAAAKK